MSEAVVVLGSNVEPEHNLPRALAELRARFRVLREASPRWTDPAGPAGQPRFANAALRLVTERTLDELRIVLRALEADLGRVRGADRYAPRPIDLDVVAWDGEVIDADVGEREYLRQLLAEVGADSEGTPVG